jgi:hypothetical protein
MDEKYFGELNECVCIGVTESAWLSDKAKPIIRQIFLDGRREQARLDREAVEKIPWPKENFTEDQINFCGGVIITALDEAKMEGK